MVFVPDELVNDRFTVYAPSIWYVWVAFRSMLFVVLNHVLSPNDQFHKIMPKGVDVSLNWTFRVAFPLLGDPVKSGIGSDKASI